MNAGKSWKLLILLITLSTALQAQTGHSCPSDEMTDSLLISNPIFSRSFFYMEQKLAQNQSLPVAERTDEIYTLPVVVHVIHKGEPYGTATNITDEQINSAITALNQDFRHMPGTPGYGDGPDIGIQFCLAARDPNGQPTTGIVRVNGSSVPNYSTQGIASTGTAGASESAVKALSTWPNTSYVNIWVVSEIENNDGGNGIQGYAYFPTSSPLDGIVILFNAFGTVGNLKSNTDMNRVLTHEMGHYFSLYHTFHGTNSCSAESNCTTAGDRVCDTPVTTQNASCSAPACSSTQQVENYMDYTPESCQNMFTEGQKLRMRTSLETQRTTMLSSLGCMPVYTRDAGITSIIKPTGTVCAGGIVPQVTLTNFGSSTLTSVTINYNVDGTGSNTMPWTGSLSSGTSVTVDLPAIAPSSGAHSYYAWTSNPNGQSDQNTSNDQSNAAFIVASGATASLVVTVDYFGSETTWQVTNSSDAVVFNGGPYVNNQQGLQYTIPLCLSPGCYTLTFTDAYGDGQGFTNGNYVLYDANNAIFGQASGNWGAQSVVNFCINGEVPGNAPVASFNIQDNTVCRNTQVDFTSTSTNSPTTYAWTFEGGTPSTSSAANPQNIVWATAGTYDITLTASNANGSHTYVCTDCMTVYADPTLTLTATNPTCNNGTNGSVASTATGNGPFTYLWSNGAVTSGISNIAAGTYTCTVTNTNGCTTQSSATVANPTAITITGTATNITCNGLNNGSITVSATGGTGNKTFSWSNGASGATISNLAAGSYTVTATDANGCTKTQAYTITAPSAIVVTGTATNITCGGTNNGSITVSATGGTGNKTFTWSNGASGATVNNLASGTYTVTATDANGCTKTQTFTITAPTAITVTGTATNITCGSTANGSITVSATGGTGNKTFTWSNGATGATVNNLSAGSYSVTATDANGCTATQTFTITSASGIVITGTPTMITCNGATNGSITVSATGGTGNKTFTWSNGATEATVNNLAAGTYIVTATDAAGCSVTQSYTITAPAAIAITGTANNITCNGVNNGSITVSATGGTGNKTFSWSNGATGATINNLAAGAYTVTATDANGCTKTQTYTITAPTAIDITGTANNITCNGLNNGSITVSATGGTGNKTFTWSNGTTGATASNLAAGSYTVTATDANGCTKTQSFTITAPAAMNITGTVTNVTCNGNTNGSITVSATGGTGNKTFTWSNGSTGATATNLAAGSYIVTATDANGCTKTQSFTVLSPAALQFTLTHFDISCTATTGSATVSITGGTAPYTVNWSNGTTGTNTGNLAAGNYSVTVTDTNGCNTSQSFTIDQSANLTVYAVGTALSCNGMNNGTATAVVGNGNNCTYLWNTGATTASIGGLAAGTYSVVVTESSGCQGSAQVTIVEPAALNVVVFKSDISCFGMDDGSAIATVTGGVMPYSYEWSGGETATSIDNLAQGVYTFSIVDANGCVSDESVVITEPDMLTANIIILSDETCAGNDGSAIAIINGGSPDYDIIWSNGQSSETIENLSEGIYTFQATDANGCEVAGSATINNTCGSVPNGNTKLIDSDCNSEDVLLNAIIKCDQVDNATMYQWQFSSESGALISNEYSLGNSFYVSQIPGVDYSTLYRVEVKAMVASVWGEFGESCTIRTIENPLNILTGLTAEDCGSTIQSWGETLMAEEVPGAYTYQWHITGIDYDWTTYTDINVLLVDENMGLQSGQTYSVQMRCSVGAGLFSEWGPVCTFTVGLEININDFPQIAGILLIYPNPGTGENIFFNFGNLPKGSTVEDLTLFDAAGNLVEIFKHTISPETGQIQEYRFEHKLATGMYLLTFKFNGSPREERLIVR